MAFDPGLGPDFGAIDAGKKDAVAEGLWLLWQLVQAQADDQRRVAQTQAIGDNASIIIAAEVFS